MSEDDRALIERCRKARRDRSLAVIEGLHALKHALRFRAEVRFAWTEDREALAGLAHRLAPDIAAALDDVVTEVPSSVFSALAPRPIETGVLAIANRPDPSVLPDPETTAPSIWLESPAHLGNVGAVVRVAAAAGAAAVYTSGRHDPWDSAALRGSAGLHFALPVRHLERLPKDVGPLIAIDPEGDPFRPADLPPRAVLAFGSERRGLSDDLLERADRRLALPMQAGVSSLNLSTAVSAVLYAWRLAQEGQAG